MNELADRIAVAKDSTELEVAKEAMPELVSAATTISALFTTLLGLVLGHYFGQRAGTAVAREERIEKEQIAEGASQVEEEAAAAMRLNEEALQQAMDLLPENTKIPPDSPLARYQNLATTEGDSDNAKADNA